MSSVRYMVLKVYGDKHSLLENFSIGMDQWLKAVLLKNHLKRVFLVIREDFSSSRNTFHLSL